MNTAVLIAIAVTATLLVVTVLYYVFMRSPPPESTTVGISAPLVPVATSAPPPPPSVVPSVVPSPAPTSAPSPQIIVPSMPDVMYVPEYRYGLAPLPPPPPPGWVAHGYVPTVQLVPGAAWPALVGRNRDTAVAYVMRTYPRLTVRALPYGTPIKYSTASDRLTILYDPHTRRVITARVG